MRSGASASAIEAFAVETRAQPMKTHHAITLVPTGPSVAKSSQSRRVGSVKSRRRPVSTRASHASIAPPATTKRRKDSTSGEMPSTRVSAAPTTNVAANAATLTVTSTPPTTLRRRSVMMPAYSAISRTT